MADIELLIKIPVKTYNALIHTEFDAKLVVDEMRKSIVCGTPQPKTGRWLEKEIHSDKVIEEWQSARCSVCDKYHTTPYMYYFDNYKFCPNCGAKMEVEKCR